MYKQTISALYVVNIVFQALFSLLFQIGFMLLIGWLSTTYLSAPMWIYIPLVLFGVITGFISMIKFILTAMRGLDRLEEQHKRDGAKQDTEQQ